MMFFRSTTSSGKVFRQYVPKTSAKKVSKSMDAYVLIYNGAPRLTHCFKLYLQMLHQFTRVGLIHGWKDIARSKPRRLYLYHLTPYLGIYRSASEEVIIQLVSHKCLPKLLYGTEVCPLLNQICIHLILL